MDRKSDFVKELKLKLRIPKSLQSDLQRLEGRIPYSSFEDFHEDDHKVATLKRAGFSKKNSNYSAPSRKNPGNCL
jgi:hypothetical protein